MNNSKRPKTFDQELSYAAEIFRLTYYLSIFFGGNIPCKQINVCYIVHRRSLRRTYANRSECRFFVAVKLYFYDTIRYDTIEEINVDSKAEYTA